MGQSYDQMGMSLSCHGAESLPEMLHLHLFINYLPHSEESLIILYK